MAKRAVRLPSRDVSGRSFIVPGRDLIEIVCQIVMILSYVKILLTTPVITRPVAEVRGLPAVVVFLRIAVVATNDVPGFAVAGKMSIASSTLLLKIYIVHLLL